MGPEAESMQEEEQKEEDDGEEQQHMQEHMRVRRWRRLRRSLCISACVSQGGRKYMEDKIHVEVKRNTHFGEVEFVFVGVFDGHGGKEASVFAKEHLLENIVKQAAFEAGRQAHNDAEILRAIKEGFLETHQQMRNEVESWPRTTSGFTSTSGTTASIAFIMNNKLYTGHVGDSAIVLGSWSRPGRATPTTRSNGGSGCGVEVRRLTRDHKPDSPLEWRRIGIAGGEVLPKAGVFRVVWNRPQRGHQGPLLRSTPLDKIPFLAVARSLGDLWSYNSETGKFVVSPEPDVDVVELSDAHCCLVLGSDGLYNVLRPEHAVDILKGVEVHTSDGGGKVVMKCGATANHARLLVRHALLRWGQLRADNVSAVAVVFDEESDEEVDDDDESTPEGEAASVQTASSRSGSLGSFSLCSSSSAGAQMLVGAGDDDAAAVPHGNLSDLLERTPNALVRLSSVAFAPAVAATEHDAESSSTDVVVPTGASVLLRRSPSLSRCQLVPTPPVELAYFGRFDPPDLPPLRPTPLETAAVGSGDADVEENNSPPVDKSGACVSSDEISAAVDAAASTDDDDNVGEDGDEFFDSREDVAPSSPAEHVSAAPEAMQVLTRSAKARLSCAEERTSAGSGLQSSTSAGVHGEQAPEEQLLRPPLLRGRSLSTGATEDTAAEAPFTAAAAGGGSNTACGLLGDLAALLLPENDEATAAPAYLGGNSERARSDERGVVTRRRGALPAATTTVVTTATKVRGGGGAVAYRNGHRPRLRHMRGDVSANGGSSLLAIGAHGAAKEAAAPTGRKRRRRFSFDDLELTSCESRRRRLRRLSASAASTPFAAMSSSPLRNNGRPVAGAGAPRRQNNGGALKAAASPSSAASLRRGTTTTLLYAAAVSVARRAGGASATAGASSCRLEAARRLLLSPAQRQLLDLDAAGTAGGGTVGGASKASPTAGL